MTKMSWLAATILLSMPAAAMAAMPGLEGRWKSTGGEIEVKPCTSGPGLCVVVASGDDSPESMASMIGAVAARNIVPDGPNRWRGRYVGDNKNLAVTITLPSPNVAEMRVCLLSWFPYLLCQTPRYQRVVQ